MAVPLRGASVRDWAAPISSAVRKARGRAVRVRTAAPAAGRLEARVLDARGRTLARGATRFVKAGPRTLTIRPTRRGKGVALRLTWTPRTGAAETYKTRL